MNEFTFTRLYTTTSTKQELPWFEKCIQRIKTGHITLYHDFKYTRWLRALGWFVALAWVSGLLASIMYISLGTVIPQNKACLPDGSFSVHPESFNSWSSSGFFQITLGGGRLTFEQAKAIDIIWDIVSDTYNTCLAPLLNLMLSRLLGAEANFF